jgi:NADP-dependent 3-hydroxy acid dehydrogenase YdfG/uncharacterized protein YciI
MLVLVTIAHTAAPEQVAAHRDAHRAYLRGLHARGTLVASGPFPNDHGGALLLEVADEAAARAVIDGDPYHVHGVARHEARVWTPTFGASRLAARRALDGKVALVTGASSGIGEATALALARLGARVAVAARRADRLDAIVQRVAGDGGEAVALPVDVTRDADVRGLVRRVEDRFDALDILVNNAGIMLLAPVAEATGEDWERMIRLNLLSVMQLTQSALPAMKRRGGGHVVNIASLAGRIANPGAGGYAATKFGVVAFSESLRREVYKDAIRVTVIEPGVVATELGDHVENAGARRGLAERVAAMRVLDADDVAAAVSYAVTQPAHAAVNEIVLRPTAQER